MKPLSYFEKRQATTIWQTYNDTEKYHKELIEIYRQANDEILQELYKLGELAERDGWLTRSEFYRGQHLKRLSKEYEKVLQGLGDNVRGKGQDVVLKAGKAIYETTGKQLGVPVNYNKKAMLRLLQEPWKGATFSDRIWRNQAKLHTALMDKVRQGMATGKNATQIALDLNKEMGTGLYNASRLVRTETMHHLNDANLISMKEAGVKKVREVVTIDDRTSEECAPQEGKIHDIDKAPVLPRHPHCRCILVAVIDAKELAKQFDEMEAEVLAEEHIARMRIIEPKVTSDLQRTAQVVGGNMEGLQYRLKEVDSLQRKILSDAKDKGITLVQADAQITDVLRYTMSFEDANFTDGYFGAVDKLKELGYTENRVKNTFRVGAPYKGVNTLIEINGEVFELQYHTPKSLEVKEINHKLYEQRRLLDTVKDSEEIERLTAEMIRLNSEIPHPTGVERIKWNG